MTARAYAPGRVNLIGDHTDYTGGFALPLAIDRGTTVSLDVGGDLVELRSRDGVGVARVPLDVPDPAHVEPPWARYVAGVVAVLRPARGGTGEVTTSLPVGAGLSSSAALEVAVALALGFNGSPRELAAACRRAEEWASGEPCGLMDQLTVAAGVDGHALLIDFASEAVTPVPVPGDVDVMVVHSGTTRALARSAYAQRRAECEQASAEIGPLRDATIGDASRLTDPTMRRRARHVVSENARVHDVVTALAAQDVRTAGTLMLDSHRSLRDDFEVSTPELDQLVDELAAHPGVYGARLTGAGFGGCVVALTAPGALDRGWRVRASRGAAVISA